MKTLLGIVVMMVALSFLGLPAAMAADGTPPTTQNSGDSDKDKDKHHRHHHRHHRRHHHHRHHKHPETPTTPAPGGTNS